MQWGFTVHTPNKSNNFLTLHPTLPLLTFFLIYKAYLSKQCYTLLHEGAGGL